MAEPPESFERPAIEIALVTGPGSLNIYAFLRFR